MIRQDELIVDNFAGGGGASTGIERALGRHIDIAINHDPEAIAMHAANHPLTKHLCENVWEVDIEAVVAGRKVGLAWFSPDCCHFSKAKGGTPVKKDIRGLAWVVLRWAGLVKPRVIALENVEEFKTWGPVVDGQPCKRRKGMTFKRWVTQLRNLGYVVEWRELRACDYGAPTIRKRLFIVARRDKQEIVWPEPTHAPAGDMFLEPYRTAAECIDWSVACPSIFERKKPLAEATLRRIARGIQRYVINSPKPFIVNLTHGGRIEPIDEPLRTTTTANRGEKAVVTAFVERQFGRSGGNSVEQPLATTTSGGGGKSAIVCPTLIQTGYGEREGQAPRAPGLDKPLGTVVAGAAKHALVSAFLAKHFGGEVGTEINGPLPTTTTRGSQTQVVSAFLAQHNTEKGDGVKAGRRADEPISTLTASGRQQQVVIANLLHNTTHALPTSPDKPLKTITTGGHHAAITSHLLKLRGTCRDGQPVDEPAPTISAQGNHVGEVRAFLLKYYGVDQDPRMEEPLHTITVKHRFGLVTIAGEDFQIVDIGMRMLSPKELFKAQGFPTSYIIDRGRDVTTGRWGSLTKTAQVRMCGNSVSPPCAEAVVRAQFGSLNVMERAS